MQYHTQIQVKGMHSTFVQSISIPNSIHFIIIVHYSFDLLLCTTLILEKMGLILIILYAAEKHLNLPSISLIFTHNNSQFLE